MPEQQKPLTAFPTDIKPQSQEGGPGLDSKMEPAAVWTQLEYWGKDGKPYLKEYEGRGLLTDKAVLITGGDSGIGRSVAMLMAREGADVSILYLPAEEEDAKLTLDAIKKSGRKGHGMAIDITQDGSCKKAIDEHMSVHGRLNVLVNNAAMQEMCEDLKDIDIAVVNKTFQTNIIGMIAMTKYALPHMKRGDSIINSCSVAGYMGNPTMVDYASTKGAIATFTRSLAQQQAPNGIRVNAVAPGKIWTPLQPATKNVPEDAMPELNSVPLGRVGMPVEVAVGYVFLASPMGTYFTGEVIHGTGGVEMQG